VQNFGYVGLYLEVAPFEDFFVLNLSKTCVIFNFESVIVLMDEQPNYCILQCYCFVRVH